MGWEELGGPSGESEGVGRAGRGWEAFLKGAGGVSSPSWRDGKGREALLEGERVWEALLENWDGAGGPFGWPGGLETFPKGMGGDSVPHGGREGLRSPPGGPEGVKRPFRRAGRDREGMESMR